MANKPGAKIDKLALDARLNELRSENTAREFLAVGGQERKNTDPALDIDRWARLLDPKVDGNKVDKAAVRDLISRTALGEFQSGRYKIQYMDNSLERLKQLGLLTPEHVAEYNKAAGQRAMSNNTYFFRNTKYPYGIDNAGNPLPPPAPPKKTETTITLKKGNITKVVDVKDTRAINNYLSNGFTKV